MYLFNSEKPHQGWVNKICMYVVCNKKSVKLQFYANHT